MRKLLFMSQIVFLFVSTVCNAEPLMRQRFFYDSNGNMIGNENITPSGQRFFYGQQGQYIGDAIPGNNGQEFYYDQSGVNVGSSIGD